MLLPDDLAAKLTAEYVSSLPRPIKEELVLLLEEKARALKETRLFQMYPDTGPLRRELYPKHIAFFAAGASHMERACIAANRVGKCVTQSTLIETLAGQRSVGDLFDAGKPFDIWAWDGKQKVRARASVPFRKSGLHDCFRVTMADGRWFEGADCHRVLTSGGWRFLDELHREFVSAHRGYCKILSVDANRVVSIDAIGRNEVYDFSVEKYHNYIAAGVVHHNTWGIGGYETTAHLTGHYPAWWKGRRFDRPIEAWACGDTSETTRDIVQQALMGKVGELGTGLLPAADIIGEPTKKSGVPGAMDTVRVRHVSGAVSLLGFKSYDQGRKKFQGTAKHVIWLDEEPPADVYDECLLRLMTCNGMIIGTFTPLLGLSEIVLRFLPNLAPAQQAA